jgi:hypothetical protein
MPRLLLLLALVVLACEPKPPDAAETYRAFTTALGAGESETAWALLSKQTRAALTTAAVAAAAAEGKPAPADGRRLAFGEARQLSRKVQRVEVRSATATTAEVEVVDEKEAHERVTLVREDGGWRVELTAALAEALKH